MASGEGSSSPAGRADPTSPSSWAGGQARGRERRPESLTVLLRRADMCSTVHGSNQLSTKTPSPHPPHPTAGSSRPIPRPKLVIQACICVNYTGGRASPWPLQTSCNTTADGQSSRAPGAAASLLRSVGQLGPGQDGACTRGKARDQRAPRARATGHVEASPGPSPAGEGERVGAPPNRVGREDTAPPGPGWGNH